MARSIPPCVLAAAILLFWAVGMSLYPSIALHWRRHHSYSRDQKRGVEDGLERGEMEDYMVDEEPNSQDKIHTRDEQEHESQTIEAKQLARSIYKNAKKSRRNTFVKSSGIRARQTRARINRRARRNTLKQRLSVCPSFDVLTTDDDTSSEFSADDYDELEKKREKRRSATIPSKRQPLTRRMSAWWSLYADDEDQPRGADHEQDTDSKRTKATKTRRRREDGANKRNRRDTVAHLLTTWLKHRAVKEDNRNRRHRGASPKEHDSDSESDEELRMWLEMARHDSPKSHF